MFVTVPFVPNLLSAGLLSKNVKMEIHETVILPQTTQEMDSFCWQRYHIFV